MPWRTAAHPWMCHTSTRSPSTIAPFVLPASRTRTLSKRPAPSRRSSSVACSEKQQTLSLRINLLDSQRDDVLPVHIFARNEAKDARRNCKIRELRTS